VAAIEIFRALLFAAAGLAIGLAVLSVIGHGRQSRFEARLARVQGAPVTARAEPGSIVRADLQAGRLRGAADRLFGIDRSLATPSPVRLWHALAAAALAGLAAVWLARDFIALPSWAATAVGLTTVCFVPRLLFTTAQKRLRQRLLDQFPDAIGLMVRAVRSGIPIAEGIRVVAEEVPAPIADEFRRIADEIAVGVSMEAALGAAAARINLPEIRFFVVTVVLQRETGGNLTETLENLGDIIRKRRALRQRAKALTAEAKTSTYVLAALPFVTVGGLMLLSPDYASKLFTTPNGKMLLGIAALCLMAGLGTMQGMIRRALR
jgi:tight adherence protein B